MIAGFAKLPQTITGKNYSSYIVVEFEIDPANSKIVDIYSTISPFAEKEILYQACLENNIEAGIKKAIEQLDRRFFGKIKRAIIDALEDAYKYHRKIMKTRRYGNLNIKIETLAINVYRQPSLQAASQEPASSTGLLSSDETHKLKLFH